jgi:hypothetical protein
MRKRYYYYYYNDTTTATATIIILYVCVRFYLRIGLFFSLLSRVNIIDAFEFTEVFRPDFSFIATAISLPSGVTVYDFNDTGAV